MNPFKRNFRKLKAAAVAIALFALMPLASLANEHTISKVRIKPPLDSSLLDFEALNGEPDISLEVLLKNLAQTQVKAYWHDESGKLQTGKERRHGILFWRKSDHLNGAAALALTVAADPEQKDLLSRLIVLAPENAIVPYLKKGAGIVLDETIVSHCLLRILGDETKFILGADLINVYLKFWSHESKERLQARYADFLKEVIPSLANDENRPRTVGVFWGMVAAGGLKYASDITNQDNHRLWVANSATNIIWASTTLLGVFPIAGNIVSGVGGGISLGVVIANAVYSKEGARDYASAIREFQGQLEWKLLNSENSKQEKKMFKFMASIIHMNGFAY